MRREARRHKMMERAVGLKGGQRTKERAAGRGRMASRTVAREEREGTELTAKEGQGKGRRAGARGQERGYGRSTANTRSCSGASRSTKPT